MFVCVVPLLEKALRTIGVYFSMLVLLRLGGRRELAQLTGFDLVVMLLLSNVVQNAIIGNDNSLWGGVFGAAVLIAVNAVVVRLAAWIPMIDKGMHGGRSVLAVDGRYNMRQLRRLGLGVTDVAQPILEQGGDSVADTRLVTLEPGGSVLVRLRQAEQNASYQDISELRERLQRIEQLLRRPGDL